MRATTKIGLLLTLCTALLASGCGLKGALYLPDDPAKQRSESGKPDGPATAPTDQRTEKERRRDAAGTGARDSNTIEPPAPQSAPPASGS